MFARRKTSDTDAVAAARRRLAALAAEFASAQTASDKAGEDEPPPEGNGSDRDAGQSAAPADQARQPLSLAVDDSLHNRLGAGRRVEVRDLPAGPTHAAGRHRQRGEADPRQVRWGLTAHHLVVASLVVIALLVLAAWWIVRAMPHAEQVQLSNTRSIPAVAVTTTLSGTSSTSMPSAAPPGAGQLPPSATFVVDVTGKVRRPGIVELPSGARVIDAIKEAGGVRPGVDTSELNLARVLVDGEQLVVGMRVPAIGPPPGPVPTGGVPTGSQVAPVNLNTATQQELETLPGIGPVTAQSILAWRTDNGRFTAVEELLEVSGIGDTTLCL